LVAGLADAQGELSVQLFAGKIGVSSNLLFQIYSGRRSVSSDKVMDYLKVERVHHFYNSKQECLTGDEVIALIKSKQGKSLQKDLAKKIGVTAPKLSEIMSRRVPLDSTESEPVLRFLKLKYKAHFVPKKEV
jgi:DNA-binding transcriptional regulator YdaS (Cro superfamily)